MADEDRDPERWPRGLARARQFADPADPTMPPPPGYGAAPGQDDGAHGDRLPHHGTPGLRQIQFAEAYARLVAVQQARVEFLGARLAEAYEREGIGALIGHKMDADREGSLYEVSEETRGLAALEERERDRLGKLIKDGIRMGIEAKHVDVLRGYGAMVVASMRQFATQIGLDWDDEATKRAASRAIIAARTASGDLPATMDRVGAPLSEEERQRITRGSA